MIFDENGIMNVFVSSAGGAIPIENAIVHLRGSSDENQDYEASFLTDNDGLVEGIILPTPPRSLSLLPSPSDVPFGLYDVKVMARDHYEQKIYNVPIFSGVRSTLPVNLIPSTAYGGEMDYPRDNLDILIFESLYSKEEI